MSDGNDDGGHVVRSVVGDDRPCHRRKRELGRAAARRFNGRSRRLKKNKKNLNNTTVGQRKQRRIGSPLSRVPTRSRPTLRKSVRRRWSVEARRHRDGAKKQRTTAQHKSDRADTSPPPRWTPSSPRARTVGETWDYSCARFTSRWIHARDMTRETPSSSLSPYDVFTG